MAALTAAYGADHSRWRWGGPHRAHFPNAVLSHIRCSPNGSIWLCRTDGDNYS
jgi:hypothetical protein